MTQTHSHLKKYFLSIAAIAIAYYCAGEMILAVPALSGAVSPVWPSSGIAMAGLLIVGRRGWPGVMLGSFFLAYNYGGTFIVSLGGALGATAQAVVGTTLLEWSGAQLVIDRLRNTIKFIGLVAVVSSAINATWSTLTLLLVNRLEDGALWNTWSTFWLGDGMGILIVTPVLILLSQIQHSPRPSVRRVIEIVFWFAALIICSWFIFHGILPISLIQYPVEYLPFALLIWAILRFGQLPAVLGSSVVAAIAVSGAVQNLGPFAARAALTSYSPIWLLQAFMAVIASTTLLLSTAVRQQRTTQSLLQQSEASLRNAQRIAKLGHWDYDLATQRWVCTGELCQLLGINNKHIYCQSVRREDVMTQMSDPDCERVQHLFERAIREQRPYTVQYCLTLPSGEKRHVFEQVEINAHCITGIMQDVTEQTQAEQALRESEEKFSKAFGFSPDAMTLSTLKEGRIINVNESFLRLSGYQRHEVINHTVTDLGIWADMSDRQWLTDQLRQQKSVRNREFEFRVRSGKSIFALVSAEILRIREQPYLLIVARDITEQKRADEQLRLSIERDRLLGTLALHIRETLDLDDILSTTVHEVRHLLQASRVFIGRFDTRGHGTVVAESVLPEFSSLMHEPIDEEVYQEICRMFRHMPIVAIDDMEHLDHFPCLSFLDECVQQYQVKAALGVPILLNDSLYGILVAHHCDTPRPWQAFEKELLEQLATQVAIAIQQGELYAQVQKLNAGLESQVKERTQQLEEKMAELQEVNQLRDVFLHAVSHDLLTSVKGNLMMLQTLQAQSDGPVHLKRHCLDRMIQAGEGQLNKLNSLQEAYTFKKEGIHLDPDDVQPEVLIQSAVAELTQLIEKNHAVITVHCPQNLPHLSVDKTLLIRVFKHLLRNAIIHNPPAVNVDIRLHTTPHHLVCTIEDNGIGMPEDMCDRLFQLCIGTPDNPQLKGISLGLYFCHHVIDAHGGTITVSSLLHEGTAFTISLPLSDVERLNNGIGEIPHHGSVKDYRIPARVAVCECEPHSHVHMQWI